MKQYEIFFNKIVKSRNLFVFITMMFLFTSRSIFTQTIINTWEGTSSETVNYKYMLNINFQGRENAYANICFPKDIDTHSFSQIIGSHTFNYSIEPADTALMRDIHGNEYMWVKWNTPLDSVKVTFEANITVNTEYGKFISSAHYPLASELIPDSIQQYLESTYSCQSEAPEIINLADSLVFNSISEADAVIKIINWVRYHMKWICTCSMPFVYSDALNTLLYGGGNCVNFGNLSLALLRAAGIPTREVSGPMIHEWTASCGHRWVEAYYPDKGWIQYETSYWMPNEGSLPWTFLLPRHIKTFSGSGVGVSSGNFVEEHQTSTNITSSPSPKLISSASIDTNAFITYCITIRNDHSYEANTVFLSTSVNPSDWQIFLSQDSISFYPEDPWGETRDIAITIAPPQHISQNDTATVRVTATSQYSKSFNQLIYSFIPDLSKVDDTFIQPGPADFSLMQNYPNPFNSQTIIQYAVERSGHVSLIIYDIRGRKVCTLVDTKQEADHYSVTWNGTNDQGELLASGIYVCTMKTKNFFERKKIIYLK